MREGKWSWKRMVGPAAEKFTLGTVKNYIAIVDPFKLKFFDESGLKLPDIANPNYGLSIVGKPCVEIFRNMQT